MEKNPAVFAAFALFAVASLVAVAANAVNNVPSQPPLLPAIFSGSATINGNPAPAGTLIEAKIAGQTHGTLTTTAAGAYGNPDLLVPGSVSDNGAVIYFYLNGKQVSQTATWNSGAFYSLDLSAVSEQTTTPGGGSSGPSGSQSGAAIFSASSNTTIFSDISVEKVITQKPAKITARIIDVLPAGMAQIPEAVYGYFNISSSAETSAEISFHVEKSWIAANSISEITIVLKRYSGGAWTDLPTTMTGSDAGKVYFSADTPGFSIFAISGKTADTAALEKSLASESLCPKKRTKAYDPKTLECVEYPSDCAVPAGWIPISPGGSCPVKQAAVAAPTGFATGGAGSSIAAGIILFLIICYLAYSKSKAKKPAQKTVTTKPVKKATASKQVRRAIISEPIQKTMALKSAKK